MGLENNNDASLHEYPSIVLETDDDISDFLIINQEDIDSNSVAGTLIPVDKTSHAMDKDSQLKRDIEMLSQAIVQYGSSEHDKIKAYTLLKSVLFLYFGDMCYRDQEDKQFHSWKELNAHSGLEVFPIASVLLHGSRALIEFSSEVSDQLIKWFIPDETSWRHAATHGIEAINAEENKPLANKPPKQLREIKVGLLGAGYQTAAQMLPGSRYQHYGIDVALGGAGNKNHSSGAIVEPNGEHGHLYVYHAPKEGKHGGLLLGIEQSAPGKSDQYGGSHDPGASEKAYSASGGHFFRKNGALENVPIANYYDSLWNFISNEEFSLIQESYNKLIVLVGALSLNAETKDDALNLVKEIVSSSGNGNKETFDAIFNRYYTKTSWYQSEQEKIQALNAENNGLKQKIDTHQGEKEEQQRELQGQEGMLKEQEKGIRKLSEENEGLKQEISSRQAEKAEHVGELKEQADKIQALNAENNRLKQKIDTHQGEKEEQQRELQGQEGMLKEQEKGIRKLSEENEGLKQEISSRQAEKAEHVGELKEQADKIQVLNAENNGLKQKIDTHQGEKEEQQRKLQEQEGMLKEQEKGIQALSAENDELKQEISSHQGEKGEQERRFQEQAEKIRELEQVNRLLRQQLIPNTDENLERETEALSINPVAPQTLALENTESEVKELQTLATKFMESVKNNMGRFSKNSNKAVIFTQLIDKLLDEKNTNELSEEKIAWLLKNFISVSMMNRYDKKGGETHSGKTCLSLLNNSSYKRVKELLFSEQANLTQDDLFKLLNNGEKELLTSARNQQRLYSAFFGFAKTDKNISEATFDSAMREFIYKP